MKLSKDQILEIVTGQLNQSEAYPPLQTPLDYYLGNLRGDEVEGRSAVISTDVADAIEWIMPQIMKAFTQSHEVVVFDPTDVTDELQAELESQYVYDVLMKENDGFILLHQFVKDALLHNNGLLKVFYEDRTESHAEVFTGLTQEQVVAAVSAPNVEVISYTQDDPNNANLKIRINTPNHHICIQSVPLEQFRYNLDHNSIDLDSARFTAHVVAKTYSDLVEAGYKKSILEKINFGEVSDFSSDYRFYAQHETTNHNLPADDSMQVINVSECYLKLDVDGDGIAEYVKVTVAGVETPTVVLSVEEVSSSPWVATTGILMSHKFRGLSIYDRLKQIQDAKTTLWRNMLDNLYLQNNQRNVVVEGQVNLDDLLISRPGGIIRAKRLDAIQALTSPSIGQDAYSMMQYFDQVRVGRVGVAPEGDAAPQNIGERVGSQGLDRMLTAKEELVGLIIRVIAETGIKPLCLKIRELCNRHIDAVQDIKFRGQWLKTNPAEWRQRRKTTIRVGTGTGNHNTQVQSLWQLLQTQKEIFQFPGQTIVTPQNIYATLNDLLKLSELNGAEKYFIDPSSPQGQQLAQQVAQAQQEQQQKQDQQNLAMLQAQAQLAQAEMQKAAAQQENVRLKAQVDALKQDLERAVASAEVQAAAEERALKKYEIDNKLALELTKLETSVKTQQDQNVTTNRSVFTGGEKSGG